VVRLGITTTLTTAIPCILILALGYRHARAARGDLYFARYAPTLAVVAIVWLSVTPIYDAIIPSWKGWTPLYSVSDYFVDLRFYFGWFLGLLLTHAPEVNAQASEL
jgi:hypothetical protein